MKNPENKRNPKRSKNKQNENENNNLSVISKDQLSKLINAAPILEKILSCSIEKNFHYKGPLPKQVTDNLTAEQSDLIVKDFINSKEREYNIQEKLVENVPKDKRNKRFHSTLKFIISLIGIIGIFFTLIYTNNIQLIMQLLPIIAGFLGGGGFLTIVIYSKLNKERKKDETIEIQQD